MSYKTWRERLETALVGQTPDTETWQMLERLALVSDFAIEVLRQQPELIAQLGQPLSPLQLPEQQDSDWPRLIRRWRRAQSVKLIWRDVSGLDDVERTLAGSTWIAEHALSVAYSALLANMKRAHGTVLAEDGAEQHMTVLGLGKLGGGELNFSSDVDLVYAFTGHGDSDGERPLPAETYFTRLGQRLANLLDEVTADGFSHRVDLRLRPFGASGRLLLSFDAMEQYFQSAGRDWERYAWLKARPVAGDIEAGERLLALLRPFVYRRYLDFTAIDGLREMKAKIEAEVQRREIIDDLKLGRGGIREIEFYVQAMQIIYGGRNPSLQLRGLLPALDRLTETGLIAAESRSQLHQAYLFLRRLENRVQMIADAQVHHLPEQHAALQRLATGLGYADTSVLREDLEQHRRDVERLFTGLLGGDPVVAVEDAAPGLSAQYLADLGFVQAVQHAERIAALFAGPAAASLSDRSRQRLQRVAGAFCRQCSQTRQPDAGLETAIAFLQATIKRSSYIALLDEQPSSLQRVVLVFDASPWMAERLIRHPFLLDELLDSRVIAGHMDADQLAARAAALIAAHPGDIENALLALNEFKLSTSFKIAYQFLFQGLSATDASRLLTRLAESVLQQCTLLAAEDLQRQHGPVADSGFAAIGYGSLGARSLSFNSDLDLVFLNRSDPQAASTGTRGLDAPRYFLRLAQKLIALLDISTPAGNLYEVDMRLRPDGAKGLLVSRFESFEQYQRQRAWTWELQALVRARTVAGDGLLGRQFDALRSDLLCLPRDARALQAEVIGMRLRMRAELDRSTAGHFDLKHGPGGLTDIEFFLQAQVLLHAASQPAVLALRETPELIDGLNAIGILSGDDAAALRDAVEWLQGSGLRCHLGNRKRVVPECEATARVTGGVVGVLLKHGMDFR